MNSYAYGCTSLTSLDVPDLSEVSTISGPAFMSNYANGCTSLTSLGVPDLSGLTGTISAGSFMQNYAYGCTSLTSLNAPDLSGVGTISGSNFMMGYAYGCSSLTSLALPDLSGVTGTMPTTYFMNAYATGCTQLSYLRSDAAPGVYATWTSWAIGTTTTMMSTNKLIFITSAANKDDWAALAASSGKFLYDNFIQSTSAWSVASIDELAHITFNSNGGNVIVPQYLYANKSFSTTNNGPKTLPTPSKTGYVFANWHKDSDSGAVVTDATTFSANTTLYASYVEDPITLTLNAGDGGAVTPTSIEILRGTSVGANGKTLPTPTKTGYTFASWHKGSDLGAVVDNSTVFDTDTTLYAKYTAIPKPPDPKPLVSKLVTTNVKTVYLTKKKTFKIPVEIVYAAGNKVPDTISYESSNKKIATVSATGTVKAASAYKSGTAKITAFASTDKTKKITINVKMSKKNVKLKKLTVKISGAKKGKSKDKGKLILKNQAGKMFTTSLKLNPSKTTALKNITFTSSAKSLFTIDKAGQITLTKKLSSSQAKKTYKITVKAGGKKVVLKIKFK
jgi:uncharacterized repeat protein (TIGR02543 family)